MDEFFFDETSESPLPDWPWALRKVREKLFDREDTTRAFMVDLIGVTAYEGASGRIIYTHNYRGYWGF